MARGRGSGRGKHRGGGRGGGGRGGWKGGKKKNNKREFSNLKDGESSKQSENDYGSKDKRRRLEATQPKNEVSSDEESIEEQPFDHFKQLLSSFDVANENAQQNAIDTESELSDSDAAEIEDGSLLDSDSDSNADSNADPVSKSDHRSDIDSDHESNNSSDDQNEEASGSKKANEAVKISRLADKKNSTKRLDDAGSSSERSDDDYKEDPEYEDEEDERDEQLDPFARHLFYDMPESLYDTVSKVPVPTETHQLNWPVLGQLVVRLPIVERNIGPKKFVKKKVASIEEEKKYTEPGAIPERIHDIDLTKLHIKSHIQKHIFNANKLHIAEGNSNPLSPLQTELFSVMNNYQDLYYPSRTLDNGEEVRFAYVLHAVNHVLKTRDKILHHNVKIAKKGEVLDEHRDQGLMRPKVIILVPFRDSAFRLVKMITSILFREEKANVLNMKRFVDEFTGSEISMPKINPRPEDYEKLFTGNTDDTFRIGMTVTRKALKLYARFYAADIIIASPLGLRVVVGAEGERDRDFDFLASAELLVIDQTELFYMQNWDHLIHLIDHFHLQPKESHNTDYSRVRSWALNGWARFYRQTLLFSSVLLPEMNALFNKKCHNYAGNVRVVNPVVKGSICQIVVQLPQVFHRFDANSPSETIDERFNLFIKEILPQFQEEIMNHTMIYIPSYFDFVRIRNYLRQEEMSFCHICEYTKENKTARARDIFFHGESQFMLYTERAHFFRRMRIKGIRHIVFYQPPSFPHFFSEMCNLMQDVNQEETGGMAGNLTVTVLYSKYDIQQLSAIVGIDRANRMMTSSRKIHMFVTGE